MAHFEDLAQCDYFGDLGSGRLLAVGWLEPGFEYTTGDPGRRVYERLKLFSEDPWEPGFSMGGQTCGFCRYDGFFSYRNIFIPGPGVTYVAPEGIAHYIAAHDYCPPIRFCAAVLACPDMGSRAYFKALRVCGWSRRVARPDEEEARWREDRRELSVLVADGNSLVAVIEAYRDANASLPKDLEAAQRVSATHGAWRYEATDTGYLLEFGSESEDGFTLSWNAELRRWLRKEGSCFTTWL